MFEEVEHVSD